MSWNFGEYFGLDLDVQFFGLDDQAVNQMKYRPAKLDGRAERLARYETIERMCERIVNGDPKPVILDVIEEEPDLVGEHLSKKALRRKHRDAQRYRKVRQEYAAPGNFDLRAFKKEARRRRRRQLDSKAVVAEKDVVRKYRSTFSEVEPYTVRGMRSLDSHISGFGSFDL